MWAGRPGSSDEVSGLQKNFYEQQNTFLLTHDFQQNYGSYFMALPLVSLYMNLGARWSVSAMEPDSDRA
jgi:hypothetical protein